MEKGGGRGADGHSCQTVRDGSDDVGDLRGDGDAKKQRRRPPIGSNPHNGGHGQTEWDSASGVHGGIEARSFDAARAATYTRVPAPLRRPASAPPCPPTPPRTLAPPQPTKVPPLLPRPFSASGRISARTPNTADPNAINEFAAPSHSDIVAPFFTFILHSIIQN